MQHYKIITYYLKLPSVDFAIGNFSISSGNFESSASYFTSVIPRKRESSGFTGFLDSRFHGNDT
ncbi:MAG: hypothetical protein DRH21_06140 [Deltaproteobacteria bacterium]|nr:MAG: hypothetical protein DRH21_06140 [Deltaproteobacteria bacterium]